MHFDWHFTAIQVLWTLTFAAQLVLIVVLLGRDRAGRFPWFTTSIVVTAIQLICGRELFQRLPQLTYTTVLIIFSDVVAILGLLVIVELARKAFAGVRRAELLVNLAGLLLVAAGIISMWGPWPSWKTLTAESQSATLRVLDLIAEKTALLINLLNIELGLMVVIFGRKFNAPWKSHVQRIVIGLSTASLGGIAVQLIWQYVASGIAPHSLTPEQARPILDFRDRLFNANKALYVAVLVWWIVCLWIDEPRSTPAAQPSTPHQPPDVPAEAEAPAEPTSDEPETEPESPDEPAAEA
jgi:hypothetical protein